MSEPASAPAPRAESARTRRLAAPRAGGGRWEAPGLLLAALLGVAALVAAMVPAGPDWLGIAGAVVVATTFTMALAGRTGGRPVVFGLLALALGVAAWVTGVDELRTAAAILACAVAAVLAVMSTVPARSFLHVVREAGVAVVIGGVGALATVGFEPTIALARFEYAVLALSMLGAFALVYRLGAGFHGLGRRGLIAVLVGCVVLAVILLYAELLRAYGTPGLVGSIFDVVAWSREHLGAFPRPIAAVLGVPALAWGCHMRARRRQGWWVCAFGAAATSAAATALADPAHSVTESALSVLYGLVVGLVIGGLLIRADLAMSGSGGRRRRVDDGHDTPDRPEPSRVQALL